MAREATGDTSGSGDGRVVPDEGGGETASSVTKEVGSSGNAAAAKPRPGRRKDWLSTLMTEGEEAVHASDEEAWCASECVASSACLLAARLGWLLLGFLAGAALATTVLFLTHDGYPETCTVPT
jgi:hypothetical protein